jgi:regulator of sigma E protease
VDITGLFQSAITIVLFFAILGGLVLIHEIGHFVTARLYNVRVLEFGIGFPPRARVLRSGGETLWTLNWLPIGGFVRLEGEDGDAGDDPRSFSAQSLPVRLAILVAGVVMNILLAFVIFFGIAWLASPVIGFQIGTVEGSSPAATAGLEPGDTIFSVNGEPFDFFGRTVVDALRENAGKPVTLQVQHADGTSEPVTVTLRPASELGEQRGALGVGRLTIAYSGNYVGHDLVQAASIAWEQLIRWGGLILGGLVTLVQGFINDPTAPPPASGPVGIAYSLADIFLNGGPILTLFIAGILSVNLGVVNILPFPPLDGGRMAVLVIKRIFGTRVSLRAERLTYAVGFVFLMAFLLWVSGFDIARLGQPPP